MKFTFQLSVPFTADNPVDEHSKPVTIKLPKDDEARARRKLPSPGVGREWILVKKEN